MDSRFAAFAAFATLLIVTPGPDMALVTRNAIRSGPTAARATAFGIGAGSIAWGLASVLGVAVLLEKSAAAFTTLKLVGALYLIWLGVRALRRHDDSGAAPDGVTGEDPHARRSFLQGVLGNLLNPKAGVIFVTVFPQFIQAGDSAWRLLAMLATYELVILMWLNMYGTLIARSARGEAGRRFRTAIAKVTGLVLIGLGARIAFEQR